MDLDDIRQKQAPPQRGFSDSYLSGGPTKKRKVFQNTSFVNFF